MMINFNTINNSKYINNLSDWQKKKFANLQPLKQDTLSFSGEMPLGFNDFENKFIKLNINEQEFIKKCISSKNKIGYGQEANVYKIPFSELDGYVVKIPWGFDIKNIRELSRVKDVFPNKNFGQPIADMGSVKILKKVKGKSLCNLRNLTPKKYYEKLAKVPQQSYNDFVKDIKIINNNGYRFDSHSGNLFLDDKTHKFAIIDFMNRWPWAFIGDCIYPFISVLNDTEINENKKVVIAKAFKAAKKYDIEWGMKDEHLNMLLGKQDKTSEYLSNLLGLYLKLDVKKFNAYLDNEILKFQN